MHKLLFVFFIIAGSLNAQTADEIISQHFENTGGYINWNNLNSIRIEGTIQIGLSDEVEVEIYQKRPYLKKVVFIRNGKKILSEGYDGEKGFTFDENLNKNVILPKYKADAFETDYLNYKKKGFTVIKKNDTIIDNQKAYHIDLIKNQKRDQLFFSKEDYTLLLEKNELETIRYKKNKIFKGLEFSTEIETEPKGGIPYVFRIKNIQPNFALQEKTFKF